MRVPALAAFAVTVAFAHDARADAQECSSAAEAGQTLRASGKWLDAREKFLACSATTCPSVVRTDCARWASEILDGIPTIVIDARDAAGKDLTDVAVSIDGKMVTTKLDGRGIPLDPGSHKLHFEHQGHAAIDDEILAKEQVKGRRVAVTFSSAPTGGNAAETPVREHTIFPWILVGVGGVAVVTGVVVAIIPKVPENCDASTGKCTKLPNESDSALHSDTSKAQTATNTRFIGYITIGVGAALAIGGLLWHFLEPTGPQKKTSARVVPTFGGAMLEGVF